jgi:predicted ATPase
LVTGEAGIGKSRLTRSLHQHLQETPLTLLSYQCSQYHQDSALHPFINQLLRGTTIEHAEDSETKLTKLHTFLSEHSEPSVEDVALLAALLSIPGGDRFENPDLTPKQRKERTLRALVAQLELLCADRPVLMVFEDLHWIDPTSLELLSSIVERASKLRLLALATARPEFSAPWPNYPHAATLALSRLSRIECHALAADVTGGKSLPEEVLDQIVSRTDGVPLFVEELTKTVIETELLHDAGDRYELTEPLPEMAIPSSLHASLLSRLDRSASAKEVAQIGAAIGREFSHALVAAVAGLPEQELRTAVGQLVDAGLVFQRGVPPDAFYQFKHALVQDTAYTSLVRSRRKHLHERIARQLLLRREGGEEVGPDVLGHHCAEAGMIDEALENYFQAGTDSAARAALSEASALFDKALSIAEQLPSGTSQDRKELEVQCAKGPVLLAERGYADAEVGRTYSRAYQLWQRLDHPAEFVSVAWGEWNFNINRSEFMAATNFAEGLLDISIQNQDDCGLLLGNCSVGTTLVQRGQPKSSLRYLEEVGQLYRPELHSELVRQAGVDIGIFAKGFQALALLCLGRVDKALAYTGEAIERATKTNHAPTRAQSLALAARVASLARSDGDLDRWSSDLNSLTREHEYPHFQSQALIFEGCLRLNKGDLPSGLALIGQGQDAYQATGANLWSPYFSILKSEALDLNGCSEEALQLLNQSIEAAEEQSQNLFTAEIYRRSGRLLLKTHKCSASLAEARYRQAIEIARSQSTKLWELRATVDLCSLMASECRYAEALHILEPICDQFAVDFDIPDFNEARALRTELSGKDR